MIDQPNTEFDASSRQPLEAPAAVNACEAPLCVDLDGTLIASDTLWESLLLLVRNHPLDLAKLPFWLMRGKAEFKSMLAGRVQPDPALLPYRSHVLEFLRAEHAHGRTLLLATGADQRIAQSIADHLQIFDGVLASDSKRNCTGATKLEMIRQHLGPETAFDYAGDSAADLEIWRHARQKILVNVKSGVTAALPQDRPPERVFQSEQSWWRSLLRAMRPHQWPKNVLLFVPMIAGHQIKDLHKLASAGLMFLAMGSIASSVYLVNDLLDLAADRRHPTKRARPFASGAVSIPIGLIASAALLVVGLGIGAAAHGIGAVAMLLLYALMSNSYSFYFKQKSIVDVIVLASLYTHRIFAGSVVTEIWPTAWLLAFSMFIFLSLAFAKRYTELAGAMRRSQKGLVAGRGYRVADLDLIRTFGPGSGLCAVLVLCMYINDQQNLHEH